MLVSTGLRVRLAAAGGLWRASPGRPRAPRRPRSSWPTRWPSVKNARTSSGRRRSSQSRQMTGAEAVTSPWVLTLRKGDVTHRALWKNPQGRMGGYWEGWSYEIAAYLLDKHLGLGMVPPTVERVFRDERGSCQYWIDDCMSLRDREEKKIKMPPDQGLRLEPGDLSPEALGQPHRQRGPAREPDPDHARLADGPHRPLPVLPDVGEVHQDPPLLGPHPDGPKLMSELPRVLVDRIKALDFDTDPGGRRERTSRTARSRPSSSGATSSCRRSTGSSRSTGRPRSSTDQRDLRTVRTFWPRARR